MANLIVQLLNLVTLVLFVRAILSWFPIGYDSPVRPVADLVHRITEPIVGPVRRILPPMGGFDLSVMLVILAIQVVLIPLVRSAL
jgi:YggT family protein